MMMKMMMMMMKMMMKMMMMMMMIYSKSFDSEIFDAGCQHTSYEGLGATLGLLAQHFLRAPRLFIG